MFKPTPFCIKLQLHYLLSLDRFSSQAGLLLHIETKQI